MIGLDAGAAWAPASLPEAAGRLEAEFSRAIHVQFGGRLLVIVDAGGTSGPLHLRIDALPVLPRGAEVRVAGGRVQLGRRSIDLRSVPVWTPPPVGGPPRALLLPGAERSALAGCRDLLDRVGTLLGSDDLDAVARLLGGRGPGLTPAGDDVLAGILLTLHVFGGEERRLLRAVEQVSSTDLALAYLWWAAHGQCIEPAHAVLTAVAGDDPTRVAVAAARLCAHGASSGSDLLLGIECGLAALSLRTVGARATPP